MNAYPETASDWRHFLRADGKSGDVVVFRASCAALRRVDDVSAAMKELGIRVAELDEAGLQAIFLSGSELDELSAVSGWDDDMLFGASAMAYSEEADFVAELSGAEVDDGFDRLVSACHSGSAGIVLASAARITVQGEVILECWRDGNAPGEHVVRSSELPDRDDLVLQDVSSPTRRATHGP